MIDNAPIQIPGHPRWHDTLAQGDIVSFAFPLCEDGTEERPKPRPCLVLRIGAMNDHRFAHIAYGTSSNTRANRGLELRIRHAEDIRSAGLHKPTRFVAARRLIVFLDHPGFCCCSDGTPVLGRLSLSLRSRLTTVLAELHGASVSSSLQRLRRVSQSRNLRQQHGKPGPLTARTARFRSVRPLV